MKFLFEFVVTFLCFGLSLGSMESYRAAVFPGMDPQGSLDRYVPLIQGAVESKVDVLVLPLPQAMSASSSSKVSCDLDNYDELVRSVSEASKKAGIYVVTHILEKTVCQNRMEVVRSNMVFDREGNVISVYRKPLNNIANCTTPGDRTFTTDFGVTFGLLMEEDLLLQEHEDMRGLRHFIVAGALRNDVPLLSASSFETSWAFVNDVNVISTNGIFVGKSGAVSGRGSLVYEDLNKWGEQAHQVTPPVTSPRHPFANEDLSLYSVRPLDLAAGSQGYKETVCHGQFCCLFYVKTRVVGPNPEELGYGLAAFSGVRSYDSTLNIGVQTCAVVTCAGHYKRSCSLSSNKNGTDIAFEKISVTGNFTNGHDQYPIVLTTKDIATEEFEFQTLTFNNVNTVNMEMKNVENLLHFGIFGRDYSKDSINEFVNDYKVTENIGYIFNSEFDELFDYMWIRLRIMIFIVSIYVLEMM